MNVITDKNEPGRFLGEGVSFRAKLIGVLEVPEARGDRMCQEALSDLKMAIRAAGEHKQRIQVHVAIDGLRLRDDKTGDSLYHHPVHKISFIAQDMTDSRAFGYIFGSPDTGHRFFGIKTDKAASQVVIAMRDLFQVVFELKKKEVEMAKQQLEAGKVIATTLHKPPAITLAEKMKSMMSESAAAKTEAAEGGVAELVDLEQELCSLRRGLTQVEELTPSADPFGDSFVPAQKSLLPPPPSGSSTRGRNTPAAARVFSPSKQSAALPFDLNHSDFDTPPTSLVDNNIPAEPPELKNPPKKVLKDLQIAESEKDYSPATTLTSLTRHSGGSVAVKHSVFGASFFSADPFAETDPFDDADPFEALRDDPFATMQEFPRVREEMRRMVRDREVVENGNVFNGPLQVSLPPEPAPKSPRLQRQSTESGSSRRGRGSDTVSPPPPLPPKKSSDAALARPPPRPPTDHDADSDPAPPLPRPARKKEPMADRANKPRLSSAATNSSEDEYLSPAPPPLPAARRFDITLSQLLTCSMDELAHRLRVPAATLSSMTLPQLTDYLRSYLAADNDRAHIHIDTSNYERSKHIPPLSTIQPASPLPTERPKPRPAPLTAPPHAAPPLTTSADFKPQFEDNFTPPLDEFVANFDDFEKKANASYDRYAAFREIQEEELKAMSILDPLESKQDSDEKEELTAINSIMQANLDLENDNKDSKSPLKSLDELTIDSFNMFRKSVSPKPTPIDAKIEDIKCVMKNLQLEKNRGSVSPRDNGHVDIKQDDSNDRYAALREITITEPPEEFESIPPEAPKERKKSDEKSDGFDNSDFFDCIDNSSLSFTHVEDAFRKSPAVPETKPEPRAAAASAAPQPPAPARLSPGSMSDVVSGSSPERAPAPLPAARWAVLPARSPPSSDSSPRRRPVQTSSSSRDASPWEEEAPRAPRLPRPPPHHRDRESRHNSSGSRECLDSGSGREKDKLRDKRESRDLSRDSRESRDPSRDSRESRDRRDSGSGRDRRDSKERDHRESGHRRDRRSRERDTEPWERDRERYPRDYRDGRSRDRDYRDKERHRRPRPAYDDTTDYSDGCSGRSSSRDRWPDRWRRDERNYGSLGWRESRRRADVRTRDSTEDPRYSSTLGWTGRRSARREERERERTEREERERERRRPRRDDRPPRRDYRFSNDFSPRDEEYPPPDDNNSRFCGTYSGAYSGNPTAATRFPFAEAVGEPRRDAAGSPPTRFRFDSDSVSPRSMFEDDFTHVNTPRGRTASIAEESESELPPLRSTGASAAAVAVGGAAVASHRDIKKSESINIFTREVDPFEGDAFFACTGSDRAARRDNWPGDFHTFDNA